VKLIEFIGITRHIFKYIFYGIISSAIFMYSSYNLEF